MDMHTAEALTVGIREAWDAPVGESATVTVGDWTAEVYGHARQQGWPQPMPVPVTLKHRGSTDQATTTGSTPPQSWGDFTALLVQLDDERQAREATESLASLAREYQHMQRRYEQAREKLKGALRTAYTASHRTACPLTKYQLAKLSGIGEPTVGKWLR